MMSILTPLSSSSEQQQLQPPHMALHTSHLQGVHHKPRQQQLLLLYTTNQILSHGWRAPAGAVPADAGSLGANAEASGRRQRRRSVSEFYAELAALLPGIPSRASQVEVVDAAVAQVKALEDTAAVLEAYRAVRHAAVRGRGGAAVIEVTSREAVCFAAWLPAAAAARPGALTRVLEAFHRRGVEVLAATMTSGVGCDGEAAQVMVTAAAAAPEVVESIKADIAGIE